MRILAVSVLVPAACFGQVFGTSGGNPAEATFGKSSPEAITLRFEPHSRGEITIERVLTDGRKTSSSTILYLDGAARGFEDFLCSGKQWSRRVDTRTVEIVRRCTGGEVTTYVRRLIPGTRELVVDIAGHRRDGSAFEQRVVLQHFPESAEGRPNAWK